LQYLTIDSIAIGTSQPLIRHFPKMLYHATTMGVDNIVKIIQHIF